MKVFRKAVDLEVPNECAFVLDLCLHARVRASSLCLIFPFWLYMCIWYVGVNLALYLYAITLLSSHEKKDSGQLFAQRFNGGKN